MLSWRGLGLAFAKLYSLIVVIVGAALLAYGQTWLGRAAFLAATLLGLLPLAVGRWVAGRRLASRRAWPALACLVLLALSLGWIVSEAPDGRSRPGSRVSHRFVGGDWPFSRYNLANLVPEVEQIKLGVALLTPVDPLLDLAQARRFLDLTLPIYEEMEEDPDFRRLGSVMGWAYAELWGGRIDYGHYYLYLPEVAPSEKVPALVFLHGSVGNFKAYLWVWSHLAERHGMAVVAPSFGFGNWDLPGGTEAIDAVVKHALSTLPLDPSHLYLVGLSNGGLGVSRAATVAPERYRGLILLSPVIENEIVLSDNFVNGWRERPVLVVHGDQDRRIPVEYVRDSVDKLSQAGVEVTYREFPGEDHFLFFSQRQAVLEEVGVWLQGVE